MKGFEFYEPTYLCNKLDKKYYDTHYDLEILEKKKNFNFDEKCFLVSFERKGGIFYLKVTDFKKYYVLKTRKLVLAAGTISTTNLMLSYKKVYHKKFKIYHNPQLAIIFILRKKILNYNYNKLVGELIYKIDLGDSNAVIGTLGRINIDTVKTIHQHYRFIPFFVLNFLMYLLKDRIVIANCFLPNHYTDSYIEHNGEYCTISGGKINTYQSFRDKVIEKIKQGIKKLSFAFFVKEMPVGSDIHYTGTFANQNSKHERILRDALSKENIVVVDGSTIPGNPIYPGGYIINNAINEGLKNRKNDDVQISIKN